MNNLDVIKNTETVRADPILKIKSNLYVPCHFFDVLPDMCFILSSDGRIIHYNSSAADHFLSQKVKINNLLFSSLLADSFSEEFNHKFLRTLEENVHESLESRFKNSDGSEIDVQLFMASFTSKTRSDVKMCFIIVRDVSKLKEKELDLVRFANVAEYTVNPLEITDVDGKIIYVNPAFERSSGYSKEELIGKNPNIFSSHKHPRSFWKNMWDTIKQGKVWIGEVQNRKKSGQLFFTDLLISPIVDSCGTLVGYFGIHRDKTEQKKLEQQLIHAQKMESIGLLAAGLAHEVGNPLTSISSLVQVIQRTNIDEFTNQKLELIKSQINRISKIIRDLVNFSRRSTYELQSTEINKIVKSAIEIARVSKKAKGISFEEDLAPDIPVLFLVPDQVQQVFINILINAIDALCTDAHSLRYYNKSPKIKVRSYVENGFVNVVVQDNGIGISEESISKLFDPFFTTKKVGEGTGLGLWVSYNIIKSFQGDITVESQLGSGASFNIRLPVNLESL